MKTEVERLQAELERALRDHAEAEEHHALILRKLAEGLPGIPELRRMVDLQDDLARMARQRLREVVSDGGTRSSLIGSDGRCAADGPPSCRMGSFGG